MRLLLTRRLEQSRSLKKKLEAAGFSVSCFPLIRIKPRKIFKEISGYDWLLLTSPNATKAVFKFLRRQPKGLKVVVVGPATAALIKKRGWKFLQPKQSGGGDALMKLLKKYCVRGKRFLYPTSQIGGAEVVAALRRRGAVVKRVMVYQTLPAPFSVSKMKKILSRVDAIIFFSPSAVAAFKRKIRPASPSLKGKILMAWGKSTAKALRTSGYRVGFVSPKSDEKIFVSTLRNY